MKRRVKAWAIIFENGNLEEQPCLRGEGKHLEVFRVKNHAVKGRRMYWGYRSMKVVPCTITYELPETPKRKARR